MHFWVESIPTKLPSKVLRRAIVNVRRTQIAEFHPICRPRLLLAYQWGDREKDEDDGKVWTDWSDRISKSLWQTFPHVIDVRLSLA